MEKSNFEFSIEIMSGQMQKTIFGLASTLHGLLDKMNVEEALAGLESLYKEVGAYNKAFGGIANLVTVGDANFLWYWEEVLPLVIEANNSGLQPTPEAFKIALNSFVYHKTDKLAKKWLKLRSARGYVLHELAEARKDLYSVEAYCQRLESERLTKTITFSEVYSQAQERIKSIKAEIERFQIQQDENDKARERDLASQLIELRKLTPESFVVRPKTDLGQAFEELARAYDVLGIKYTLPEDDMPVHAFGAGRTRDRRMEVALENAGYLEGCGA